MKVKRIAVLRGGPSSEYEVSLQTGKSVINELFDVYKIVDVVVDKQGDWYINGVKKTPVQALRGIDVVFNAMHGEYGEDGKVQQILDNLSVPYTGAKALASAIAMNKEKSKEIYKGLGIKTPMYKVLSKPDTEGGLELQAGLIFNHFTMPVVIKPVSLGSSVGVSIARTKQDLINTLTSIYAISDKVLIEEYIQGKEATVGVVEGLRGQKHYPLFPVEIKKTKQDQLFDYETKYVDPLEKVCPGGFHKDESKELQDIAVAVHNALGLRHYSRSDFIVHPRRGVYILETNSLPGLTKNSLLPFALGAHGVSYREFLIHIIELA